MRKLRGFFVLVAVALISSFAFVACGDDDEDLSTGDIIGSWTVTNAKGWEKENGTIISQWDQEIPIGSVVYRFDADGTAYLYQGSSVETSTWSLSGDQLTITYVEDDEVETEIITVKMLNNDNLVIEALQTDRSDGITYEYYNQTTMVRYNN